MKEVNVKYRNGFLYNLGQIEENDFHQGIQKENELKKLETMNKLVHRVSKISKSVDLRDIIVDKK